MSEHATPGSPADEALRIDRLVDWICGLKLNRLPERAIEKAKDHLIDLLGVLIAGASQEDSARVARAYAEAQGGGGVSSLLGGDEAGLGPEAAAFAHAAAAHSLEMDDVHNASSLHPGVISIPPALALAESTAASGAQLIEAIIAAYDIVIRIGETARPSAVYRRGFHPTAVCGPFGAATAAGRLMKLKPEAMADALGLAWGFAAGNMSFENEGSWAKRLQVAGAAAAGVRAAHLAALGAVGPRRVFQPEGFFKSYSGEPDWAAWDRRSGEELRILETGIKPFACCRYNQGPIDGLLELRRLHGFNPEDVERIEIAIASTGLPLVALPAASKRRPANAVEAQFSLPYSAAVALVAGTAGPAQYREPWLSDPRVRRIAERVEAGSSPAIDRLFPRKWPTEIRLRLRGGDTLEYFSEDCLGDPEKPMSREALWAKFDSLTGPCLTPEARLELQAFLEDLERIPNAGQLMKVLRHGLGDHSPPSSRGPQIAIKSS